MVTSTPSQPVRRYGSSGVLCIHDTSVPDVKSKSEGSTRLTYTSWYGTPWVETLTLFYCLLVVVCFITTQKIVCPI